MSSSRFLFAALLSASLTPAAALAVGPGSGSDTQHNVRIGNCSASTVEVRYRLDSLMGEPVVGGSWRWDGDSSCRVPSSAMIWLKVQNGANYGFVRLDPAIPSANQGFGFNVSGSPNWDEVVCGYNGTRPQGCMDSSSAKALWKSGRVTGFEVVW